MYLKCMFSTSKLIIFKCSIKYISINFLKYFYCWNNGNTKQIKQHLSEFLKVTTSLKHFISLFDLCLLL